MATRRVLITGAAGFLGNACARGFLARGAQVVALMHRRRPAGLDGADIVRGPMADAAELAGALAGRGPFDAVIHCAGRATDVGSDRKFRDANFLAVTNLIECMGPAGIGRLVHVSTTDVYGMRDFQDADESTPLRDTLGSPYPRYKIQAELAITRQLPPRRYVILRPAAVWGPGDTSILPRVLKYLRQSSRIVHFGKWGGRNRWPLAHVDNVAKAAWLAATCDEALGEAYNVVDPEFTTVEEYFRLIRDACLPGKRLGKTVRLPFLAGWLIGHASSLISNLLGRDQPLFEPSLYGLYSASSNLDFSSRKLQGLFARHGESFVDRASGLATLARWTSRPGNTQGLS